MSNKKKPLELDMCAATEIRDVQGEILKLDGADISELLAGRGRLNDNHGSGNFNMLGRVTFAKKIFTEDDCTDERQKRYWEQVKSPYLYVKGVLFDDEDHPNAKACAAILRHIHKADAPLKLKASVEGGVVQRGLKDSSVLQSTKIHSVALTFTPANRTTLVEPTNLQKSVSEEQEKVDYELIKSVVHLAKQDREIPSFRHITRDASASKIIDNLKKIEEMANAAGIELNISPLTKSEIIDGAVKQKIFKNVNKIKELTQKLSKASKKRAMPIVSPQPVTTEATSGIVKETPGKPQDVSGTPSPKVQEQRDKYAQGVGVMEHRSMVGPNAPAITPEGENAAPAKNPIADYSRPKVMRVISAAEKIKKDEMISAIRKDLVSRLPEHRVNAMISRISSLPFEQIRHLAFHAYKTVGALPGVLALDSKKKIKKSEDDLEKGAIWDAAKAGITSLAMLHAAHEIGKPTPEPSADDKADQQITRQFAQHLAQDPTTQQAAGVIPKVEDLTKIPAEHKAVLHLVTAEEPLLGAIAKKESRGGETYKHKTIKDPNSMHFGHTAAGAWAIMPHNAAYALKNDPSLREKYADLDDAAKDILINHKSITERLNNDPHASADFARSLLSLARNKLPDDHAVAYSWLNGITGAMSAQKNRGDDFIRRHPYTKAVMNEYRRLTGQSSKGRAPAGEKIKKAVFGNGVPPTFHGWISPQGEFHGLDKDAYHEDWMHNHLGAEGNDTMKTANKARAAGWIGVGHAGHYSVSADSDILSNTAHPATKKLRSVIGEHCCPKLEVMQTGKRPDLTDADPEHFIKHGKIKELLGKSEPLTKEVFTRGWPTTFHGWISPKGDYHAIDPKEVHEKWLFNHLGDESAGQPHEAAAKAREQGWISVGHGGYPIAGTHDKIINDKSHPATKKLRTMVHDHGFPTFELSYSADTSDLDPEKYTEVDPVAFSRHGSIKPVFNKSSDLKKEKGSDPKDMPSTFHGWVSPKGDYHPMKDDEQHALWIHNHLVDKNAPTTDERGLAEESWDDVDRIVKESYKNGWASVGHGGYATVGIHKKTLDAKDHPVIKKLREMVKDHASHIDSSHAPLEFEVHDKGTQSLTSADHDHFAKYGSIKALLNKSEDITKALTAGYGGGSPTNATGGQVIQSESLDEFHPGKGFKYISCHGCGKDQVHSKNQTRCRDCGKNFSMEQLFKLLKG